MKLCPQCGQQFSDDYLFCLDDGVALSMASAAYVDVPTQVIPLQASSSAGAASLPSWIFILVGCLITALAVTVYLLVFRDDAIRRSNPVERREDNAGSTSSPSSVNTPVQLLRNKETVNTVPQAVSPEQTNRNLADTIGAWARAGESRDIESTMSFYAGTVDYYRKSSAARSFVRDDKQRYFTRFQTASVTISDLTITPSPDGSSADTFFDKAWSYGTNPSSSGKVRQELKFRRFGDKWLITGERDIKVYYVNK